MKMKKVIGYILAGLAGFAAGSFAGWMARKKTTEVAFEEISEEEQAKMIAGDGEKEPVSRPVDIQATINRAFGLPDNYTGVEPEAEKGLVQLDTRKTQYMKQWKAEEAAEKYDTRTKEVPKHVVTTDEEDDDLEAGFDHDFLRKAQRTAGDIEEATMDDWDHWLGIPDGDYDCMEVWWYDGDNVLTDEKDNVLENPERYMGFDVPQKFEEISEETTGDPDIRVVYNHREGAIFQIIRKHGSYDRKMSMEEFGDDGEDDDSEEWIRSRNE
jgi:hypothetical protein